MLDYLQQLFNEIPQPMRESILLIFPLFNSQHRFYWFYMLGFLVLIMGITLTQEFKHTPVSVKKFLACCFPQSVYSHKSAILDYQYYLVNGILKIAISSSVIISLSEIIARWIYSGLYLIFGQPETQLEITFIVSLIYTIIAAVVADLGYYLAHSLLHRIPALWEFHKIHHSAEVLTPVTGFREHLLDSTLIYIFKAACLGPILGIFSYIFSSGVETINVGNLNIVVFLFQFSINFRHSHIWLPYNWYLSHVLSSPAMHCIHHSQTSIHFNKNFGLIFSLWDYLFETIYVPREREEFTVGLSEETYSSLQDMYYRPFGRSLKITTSNKLQGESEP